MHTDELRAELTELANDVAPFAGDLAGARRRVAKRRVISGSVAAIVAIALVVAVGAGTRSGPSHVHVAGSPKEVDAAALPRLDAAVVLPVGATNADIDNVQAVLDQTDAVESYAVFPMKALALALFNNSDASSKILRARVCAAPSTRIFAVEFSRSVPHAISGVTSALGTTATVQAMGRPDVDFEIFMQVKATDGQVLALRTRIQRDPDVIKETFLDHQAAYAEFKRLFHDQPVLIENNTPQGLPESFRIELRDSASASQSAARYGHLPGVKSVLVNSPAPFVRGAASFIGKNACEPKS